MTIDRPMRPERGLLMVLFAGAVWGAFGGLVEVVLLERYYGAGFRPWLHCLDLLLNYMIYGAIGAGALALLARPVFRAQNPGRFAVSWFAPIPVLATSLWFGVTLALPASGAKAAIALLIGAILLLTGAFLLYRASAKARTLVVLVAAAMVLAGTFKEPISAGPRVLFRGMAGGRTNARNVLLILTDTLRADYLSCYGFDWQTSPHLDKLAAEGALFERHTSQSTWTLPATASLLTSLYPSSHGANKEGSALPSDPVTLAEAMRKAGYRTAAFTENRYVTPRFGFGQGFDTFRPFWDPWLYKSTLLYKLRRRIPVVDLMSKEIYPDDMTDPAQLRWDANVTASRAIAWLESNGDSPFFLFVHFMNPHGPYGPREYLLQDPPRPAARLLDHPREKGGPYPLRPIGEPLPDATLRDLIKLYAADIRYVDEAVGKLLEDLDARGIREETLVIFTADHGEEFYEHGSWNHGTSAFQSVVHVPLIVSAPGLVVQGTQVDAVTRTIDVMPTILELTGLASPPESQGRSLRGYLGLGTPPSPVAAYTEGAHDTSPEEVVIEAVTTAAWKLMRVQVSEDKAVLLYDLAGDPEETHDLASENPAMRDSLTRELERWNQAARMYEPSTREIALDPATIEELRALGYVK